ncbi:MAG: acyl-[acyl-carrier-protein]--UDP-N-acetylglucosamine O-acyltransferase, partial [Alphaproteobacteria bacterium]|nr:acyl-[acyl-carrier-protein]--UDP-N-acetylglucosamine O-acyltransferase [Alphaproteobacteria bacterium]
MAHDIHATAVIDPQAKLGNDVQIGPYCVVGPDVELGDRVRLVAHVVVDGRTKIGAGTVIYPFASIGQRPQDLKYHGEPSTLEIGENNQIREHVTMN